MWRRLVRILLPLLFMLPMTFASAAPVKVATIHFKPVLGDVPGNRARLLALSEQAARAGAKIIVNTEMATSGYAIFSRADMAKVAETIPGASTEAFGKLAKQYGVYIAIGLPEFEKATDQYFNSAALIAPDGTVAGSYRKRNTLLEASYNAIAGGPVPIFDTPYGKLAIVICADLFYPHFARLAAVEGADILLAPANTGVDLSFLKQRARENDVALIVANRYGTETRGVQVDAFDEDTFTIASPFPYDFSYGSLSAIVEHDGKAISQWTDANDGVVLGEIDPPDQHIFPVIRRPDLYALLNQDTLEGYTFTQLGLPAPAAGILVAADLGNGTHAVSDVVAALENAITKAKVEHRKVSLFVLPIGTFATDEETILDQLAALAKRKSVDLVIPFDNAGAMRQPTSILFAVDGGEVTLHRYVRTHRLANEGIRPGDDFVIVDRPYGRLSILQGPDLLAPETTMVMEKLGVDVVAVSADIGTADVDVVWRTRAADYLNIVVANGSGDEGVFLGGYPPQPSESVGEGLVLMQSDSGLVRNKKEPRHVDVTPLLVSCALSRC
ncbi:nitrilase-related carbon-nitrogen hydrolase [Mesorhizobium ciceri]|uniref:nitrilase-related carbon-nitrogen hydrolase n=1 Tax=Mesorhizobium TaxID=68287 RepID=UPI0004AF94AF|nr:nitrilase-related carbon-nitrogen hydrolase [Mesorhizobium ciceri]